MKIHPVTACYPMASETELAELSEGIKRNGLLYPITLAGDVLLDGRNRIEACKRAGVKVVEEQFKGDDQVEFILDTNRRRNLDPSQRAMVAAKIANLPKHSNQFTKVAPNGATISQSDAARIMNTSRRSIQRAVEISKSSLLVGLKNNCWLILSPMLSFLAEFVFYFLSFNFRRLGKTIRINGSKYILPNRRRILDIKLGVVPLKQKNCIEQFLGC